MKPRIQWPSIKTIAEVLRDLNDRLAHERRISLASGDQPDDDDDDGGLEVRLQVCPAGEGWRVWDGDPCYDTDHRGFWGSIALDGRRFDSRATARELIAEVRAQRYWDGDAGEFRAAP